MPVRWPRSGGSCETRNAPVLELKGLTKHFGGVRAVDNIDLTVQQGEILGLIGPNGSGKSTIVNLVCGLFPATDGHILFRGTDISALPPHGPESGARAHPGRPALGRKLYPPLARRAAPRPRRDRPRARVLRPCPQAR